MQTTRLEPATVVLPIGATLTVSAGPDAAGYVRHETGGGWKSWLRSGEKIELGPFAIAEEFRIKATTGALNYEVKEAIVASIERATEIVRSQRIITTALIEGRKAMSLQDKMRTLADRARQVPRDLEALADNLNPRLDAVETRGNAAFSTLHTIVSGVEDGVKAAEDAVNQLTNGSSQ